MISIIVPVYNIQDYIEKCIESLLAQTLSEIEIILVDDGSTDNSGIICDRYATLYPNKIKVKHCTNAGLSAARNRGIELATGDFLGFVDGDDWVEPEMYEILYKNIISSNSDLSICRLKPDYTELGETMNKNNSLNYLSTFQLRESLLINKEILGYACNKLFKTAYAKDILFDESLFSSEDIDFCVKYTHYVSKAVSTTSELYHYRQRIGSMTGDLNYSFRKLSVIKAYENVLEDYKKESDSLTYIVERYLLKQYLNILGRMHNSDIHNPKLKRELLSKAKSKMRRVLLEPKNSLSEKINILATYASPAKMLKAKQWIIKRKYQQ